LSPRIIQSITMSLSPRSDGVDFKLSGQKAAAFTGRSDCRM
jgi:hypothetical protein